MVDNTRVVMMDGSTTLAAVIANVNVKPGAPSTSIGTGEIIYRSDISKVQVNTGTSESPNWVDVSGGAGVTDHGALTGLGDDDHTQYYNSARHTKAIHDSLGIAAADSAKLGNQLPEYYATAAAYLALAGGTMTGSIIFGTGANIVNSGNVIIGVDSTSPYFPYGIVFGSSAAGSESIGFASGVMSFGANTGFAFDSPIAVPNSGIKFDSLTTPAGEIYNFNFLGSNTMVLKSDFGIHFYLGTTAIAKITASGLSVEGNKITGLSTAVPTADGDAASKKYVDDKVTSISFGEVYDDKSPQLGGDLVCDGFQIKNTTNTLIFESYNGAFLFRKVTT